MVIFLRDWDVPPSAAIAGPGAVTAKAHNKKMILISFFEIPWIPIFILVLLVANNVILLFTIEPDHRRFQACSHTFERSSQFADFIIGLDRNRGIQMPPADIVRYGFQLKDRANRLAAEPS